MDLEMFWDEDEMFLDYLNFNRPRNPRTIRPRLDLFNSFSDLEFVQRYRMEKSTAMHLFGDIESGITPRTMRNKAVTPMTKLLITLRYFATGAFMAVMADLSGLSSTSARDFVAQTIHAIAALRPKYVNFPSDMEEVKMKFYELAKLPNIVMAIDCTHIKITSPGGNDAEVYRNRKGYISMIIQTVCDSEMRVMDCVARWPGSTHDQIVFDNSRLMSRMESGEFGNGLIVADGGYENRKYLITPLKKPSNRAETLFNEAVQTARNPVEKTYNILKKRFPALSVGLRSSLDLTMSTIQAAMVLHNLALNDPLPDPEVCVNSYDDAKIVVEPNSIGSGNTQQQIIDQYFSQMK